MRNTRKRNFITESDMGNIKIFSNDLSAFFANGFGDGSNRVKIITNKNRQCKERAEFLGHFTVKQDKHVYLSKYDCSNDPIYAFGVGRWFVYLVKEGQFEIMFTDKETHS